MPRNRNIRFNWAAMGTTPQDVLENLTQFFSPCGSAPPCISWADTPQGAKFWHNYFTKGDKRGVLALERMFRQAREDVKRQRLDLYRFPEITSQPKTIVFNENWLRNAGSLAVKHPQLGINWGATPQGEVFWAHWFASSPRSSEPLDELIAAAKKEIKNEKSNRKS
jgi:hypothetical protein